MSVLGRLSVRLAVLALALVVLATACGPPAPRPASLPNAGIGIDIRDFAFASPQRGIAMTTTGTLIETVNSGVTWSVLIPKSGSAVPASAAEQPVVALSGRPYVRAVTGWIALPTPLATAGAVSWDFVDGLRGTAVVPRSYSTGDLYRTVDAGTHWTLIGPIGPLSVLHLGVSSTNGPAEVSFPDSVRGWIASQFPPTQAAVLLDTVDGGHTWSQQALVNPSEGAPEWLSAPHFFDQNVAVITGSRNFAPVGRWFWSTQDGGHSWSSPRPLPGSASTTAFVDRNRWFTSEAGHIWTTTDAGVTWLQLQPIATDYWPMTIQFVDGQHGFVLVGHVVPNQCRGCDGPPGEMDLQLLATTDGGRKWRSITTPPARPTPIPSSTVSR